jgi:uncharacterized RmlC-like cupin family protein
MADCTVIRAGGSYHGAQGLDYGAGVSAESAGAQALCMVRLTLPPGARANAHMHESHETAIYVISGQSAFFWGPRLEHRSEAGPGEFVHIPAGVPHLPFNDTDEPVEAVIARTDPNEQESVVPLPELDELPHVRALGAIVGD